MRGSNLPNRHPETGAPTRPKNSPSGNRAPHTPGVAAMEIVTKRFLLRDFIEDDSPAFEAYHADARSLEFYGAEEAKPGHALELLEIFKSWACEHPRRNYQLAIVQRQESQVLVGCSGLRSADSDARKAELGIELAPNYWARYGYAIEAMHALVEFGFGSLGWRFMVALLAPTPGLRVLSVRSERSR
jgi:RimJ/RimL family protein N-acetyltransferase